MKTTLPRIYAYCENGEHLLTGTLEELSEVTGYKSKYLSELSRKKYGNKEVKLLYKQYHEFEVYDKNGTVLFKGTSRECADYMCITIEGFWEAVIYTRQGKRTGNRGGLFARKTERLCKR